MASWEVQVEWGSLGMVAEGPHISVFRHEKARPAQKLTPRQYMLVRAGGVLADAAVLLYPVQNLWPIKYPINECWLNF